MRPICSHVFLPRSKVWYCGRFLSVTQKWNDNARQCYDWYEVSPIHLFNRLLHFYLFSDPPTIQTVTTSTKRSWIGQTVTFKCLSDGVPTPTLSWYKPEGSEINRVRGRENKVQVPLRGDQDFGHYKCIATNALVPSDEKLIKINQISE